MIYLDSSVLLELYLNGSRWGEARAVLDAAEPKASSYLLMAEVPVSLRRTLSAPSHRDVLAAALQRFDADLVDITLVDDFAEVTARIRSDSRFSRCRALDAVHACTALLLKEWTGQAVRVRTFDERLERLADELGVS